MDNNNTPTRFFAVYLGQCVEVLERWSLTEFWIKLPSNSVIAETYVRRSQLMPISIEVGPDFNDMPLTPEP